MPQQNVRILAGPTASGKSAIAIQVAKKTNGVIINADSQQVYQELQILTARPSPEDEVICPHRLYGCRSVTKACSAGHWRDMAETEITRCLDAGDVPILVGGSGLYIDALICGFVDLPQITGIQRSVAEAAFQELGQEAVYQELVAEYGTTPVPTDPARLARAWSIWHATGTPLPEWQAKKHKAPNPNWQFELVLLLPDRACLYEQINARVHNMLAAGAIDEVNKLAKLEGLEGADPPLPGLKAHGLPALRAYIAGEMSLNAAISIWQQDTRNYAKRQITWFRNRWNKQQNSFNITYVTSAEEAKTALEKT